MAFDQDITYRVNIDDSNFQAKLTQMRASLDASVGIGGGGGVSQAAFMSMMMGGGAGASMNLGGGLADFGSQLRPVTFTPMAISMQPHFGMAQVQQTLGQAGLGSMGPLGASLYAAGGAASGFLNGGLSGMMSARPLVPQNVSPYEYFAQSASAFGNRMGDAAAMGTLAGAGVIASMPFMSAGAALGSAAYGGAGLAAGAAGLLGGAAAAAIPMAYTGAVAEHYRDNIAIQNTLEAGSFRFVGSDSPDVDTRTGRGFSRAAREQIAHTLQKMEINDPRYGNTEYQQLLEGGMQMDLFSGAGDVKQFQEKFRGLVENVKTISSTLHTTVKEGLETIRGLRDMGVTSPGEVERMVLSSEVRGRASGRTGTEMLAIGQQGAELFRGTGISMERGFDLNQMNVMAIRAGLNDGTLSRETVAQAGGELAFAQRQTASVLSGFQTTIGRGMLMASFDPATGELDTKRLLGKNNAESMMLRASNLGPQGILALEAKEEELISKLSPMEMRMMDIKQTSLIAGTMHGHGYAKTFEDAFMRAGRMRGKTIEELKADIAFMKQDPEKYKEGQEEAMRAVARQQASDSRENRFSFGKRISNAIREYTGIESFGDALTKIRGGVAGLIEEMGYEASGQIAIDPKMVSKEIREIAEKESSGNFGFVDASKSNTFYRKFVGGESTQKSLDLFTGKALERTTIDVESEKRPGRTEKLSVEEVKIDTGRALAFKSAEEAALYQKRFGEGAVGLGATQVSVNGKMEERYLVQRASDIKEQSENQKKYQVTQKDREAVEKVEIDKKVRGGLMALAERFESGGSHIGIKDVMEELYGTRDVKNLTGVQMAYVEKYVKSIGSYGKDAEKEMADLAAGHASSDAAAAGREQLSQDSKKKRGEINSLLYKNKTYSGLFSEAKAEDLKAFLDLDPSDAAGRADMIERFSKSGKYSKELVRSLVDDAMKMTPEQRKKAKDLSAGILDDVKGAGILQDAVGGQASDKGSRTTATYSMDTMKQMEQMSQSLIANYEILMQMHKQMKGELLQR